MSKVISANVSDELAERIDAHREGDESRSSAVERLTRAGLDTKEADGENTNSTLIHALTIFGAVTLGIAMEPVASPEFLIGVAAGAFLLAVIVNRGIFS